MTTESVVPEVLHAWAIYLQASEEARRRGDRRTGTDHVLLALLEDPSIEVVLGVSLQQARQALESLDHEALGALGLGSGTDAPPLPMRAVPKKPTIRDVAKKDRLRMTPAAKKVLEEAVKPNRRKTPGHGPAGAGPDPHSPTTRSCGGAAGRSRREHVGGSAPIGCGHARQLSPQRHSRLRAKVSGSGRSPLISEESVVRFPRGYCISGGRHAVGIGDATAHVRLDPIDDLFHGQGGGVDDEIERREVVLFDP